MNKYIHFPIKFRNLTHKFVNILNSLFTVLVIILDIITMLINLIIFNCPIMITIFNFKVLILLHFAHNFLYLYSCIDDLIKLFGSLWKSLSKIRCYSFYAICLFCYFLEFLHLMHLRLI